MKKKKWIAALFLALELFVLIWVMHSLGRKEAPQTAEAFPTVPSPPPAEAAEAVSPGTTEAPSAAAPVADGDVGRVIISEYMLKNRAVLQSEDGSFYDWIELQNVSDSSVALGGWTLSDGGGQWRLPERELAAGGYLLVFASGQDKTEGELHADFSLSERDSLQLRTPAGSLSDTAPCQAAETDCSLVRGEAGLFSESRYPTPGFENCRSGYARWQETLRAGGPLIIHEAAVKNYAFDFGGGELYPDWLEIRNISDRPVELSGYYLSDSSKDYLKWQLPARSLAPGELLLILCTNDEAAFPGYLCAPFSLDSESERLYLCDSAHVVDFAALRDIPYGGSYGRLADQNGFFYFSEPTPGEDNRGGRRYLCEKPEALTRDGVFEDVDSVVLELRADGDIYYTLDGSLPTNASARYEGPLTIDKTCAVRAVCCDGVGFDSRPASFSFFLNEGHSLPVLSVIGDDPAALASMYKRGIKGDELPGSISFYEKDGSFTIDCGIRMAGRASLERPKKNLTFKFRGAYGDARLEYDLFGGGKTSFSCLTLRSGQDNEAAVIRNELSQDLAEQFSDRYVNQRSRYCVMYLNGEYYGVFALKEKINEQFCADYAGVSKDSVVMYNGPAIDGEEFWDTVVYPILYEDITDPAVYDSVCSYLDMDSYIDWLIVQGYTGNADLLYGNVSYFRSAEAGNKWISIFYDLDAAFRVDYYNFRNLYNIDYMLNQNSQMLRSLMKNETFRTAYLTRASEALKGPLSNENVVSTMERLYAQIDGEMPRDCLRWDLSFRNYQICRDNLIRMITASDYYAHSVEVITLLADLSDEERIYYFGE